MRGLVLKRQVELEMVKGSSWGLRSGGKSPKFGICL